MSLSPMTPLMILGMIFFIAVFMVLLMFAIHAMRTNHLRRHGGASHGPSISLSVLNRAIKLLLRIGIRVTILGPMMLLTVRGRKTGKPHTIPVDVYERDGRRFLIATHGERNWVRNLRAAHEGSLSLGRHHQEFTSVELAPELAGPIIKEFMEPLLSSQGIRGNILRQHLGVRADSHLDAFTTVAKTHPVFELEFNNRSSSTRKELQITDSNSVPERI